MKINRFPAKKVRISDLLGGRFYPGNREDFTPNYIIDKLGRKIARVNIVATVTDKFVSVDGRYMAITVDDGSGAIRLKIFADDVKDNSGINVGEVLLVVGKVRQYNGEVYILPEIIERVKDLNYIPLRNLEVLKDVLRMKNLVESIKELAETDGVEAAKRYAKESLGLDDDVLDFVKILEESKLSENEVDSVITKLLEDGIIFEPHVGKFKVIG